MLCMPLHRTYFTVMRTVAHYLQLWADVLVFWMHSRDPVVEGTCPSISHRQQCFYIVCVGEIPDVFNHSVCGFGPAASVTFFGLKRQLAVADVCGEHHCAKKVQIFPVGIRPCLIALPTRFTSALDHTIRWSPKPPRDIFDAAALDHTLRW